MRLAMITAGIFFGILSLNRSSRNMISKRINLSSYTMQSHANHASPIKVVVIKVIKGTINGQSEDKDDCL